MTAKKENSVNDCNDENDKISIIVKMISVSDDGYLDRMSGSVHMRTQLRRIFTILKF
jgi:hypothetical protein